MFGLDSNKKVKIHIQKVYKNAAVSHWRFELVYYYWPNVLNLLVVII